MNFQITDSGLLPLKRGRMIKQLSDSTISGVIDAIVELVTNADDAYERIEEGDMLDPSIIEIFVTRAKGGKCTKIVVRDSASGMSFETLRKAIEFSGDTSGFKEGKSVRGFFGRGLKESIIALGSGIILSYKEEILSRANIYYDSVEKDAKFEIGITHPSEEDLIKYGFSDSSGTIVTIDVTNEKKNYIPSSDTFKCLIEKHYSLRDVNSSSNRKIVLHIIEPSKEFTYPIKYVYPSGKVVYQSDFVLEGKTTKIKIYQAEKPLESPISPDGEAGLLIKTEGSILDNKLFGFESEPAALYFFGEIICPSIASTIRDFGDESIVDLNRGGLNWKHDHNVQIQQKITPILKPLITKMRESISSKDDEKVPKNIDKALSEICKKLSKIAHGLLEEENPGKGDIETFTIRPLFANIEPGASRSLTVYCPKQMAEGEGTNVVEVVSNNPAVKIVNEKIILKEYPKDADIVYNTFEVEGYNEGDSSTIIASLGRLIDTCEVRVSQLGKIGKHKKRNLAGGIFKKIVASTEDNPIQRFSYVEGGTLKIYTKFPGVNKYIGDHFENTETPEGRAILSEILIEAFSRFISTRRAGRAISEDLYVVLSEMDKLRRLCSGDVYSLVFNTNFKDKLDS